MTDRNPDVIDVELDGDASENWEFDEQSYGEYMAFIGGLDLDNIWLKSSTVRNSASGQAPNPVALQISDTSEYAETEDGFQVFHAYDVVLKNEKERKIGQIKVEFGIDYRSATPITDEIWQHFAQNNLHLNSWPYFREFLSTTLARMAWLPFTLPVRHVGSASVRTVEELEDAPF